jgi:predicted HD phosphohydrolase
VDVPIAPIRLARLDREPLRDMDPGAGMPCVRALDSPGPMRQTGPMSTPTPTPDRATFHAMTEGTQEDWNRIAAAAMAYYPGLPDRVMRHLALLDGDHGGFAVDRLTHSLQTATRAYRANRDDDYIACALLHDIGDTLASFNHPDVGAAIVKPFVSEAYHWMVEQHGVFQGYYFFHYLGLDRNQRAQFEGHPHYALCAEFCHEFDQPSFEPHYPTMPLAEFEPLLTRFFGSPKRSLYLKNSAASA